MRTIGKLATELGINIETIRFYERRGLIERPDKPATGYRQYPAAILERIRFIKRAQELGFTLDEVARLLSLNDQPCAQVEALARQKLDAVQAKLADLRLLEKSLAKLLVKCEQNEDDWHCPIIDSLQPQAE